MIEIEEKVKRVFEMFGLEISDEEIHKYVQENVQEKNENALPEDFEIPISIP